MIKYDKIVLNITPMRVAKSISLPSELVDFIEEQINKGGYVSISEYLRELIRAKKEEQFIRDLKESEDDLAQGRLIKANSLEDLM